MKSDLTRKKKSTNFQTTFKQGLHNICVSICVKYERSNFYFSFSLSFFHSFFRSFFLSLGKFNSCNLKPGNLLYKDASASI